MKKQLQLLKRLVPLKRYLCSAQGQYKMCLKRKDPVPSATVYIKQSFINKITELIVYVSVCVCAICSRLTFTIENSSMPINDTICMLERLRT